MDFVNNIIFWARLVLDLGFSKILEVLAVGFWDIGRFEVAVVDVG